MAKYFVHSKNNSLSNIISTPTQKSDPVPKVVSLLGTAPQKENISKQGWILKKSKHLKKYHKRFMQLKGDKLLCYKTDKPTEKNQSPTEIFDLSLHKYRLETHPNVKEKFYLINETTIASRTFKADTESERDEWVSEIRNNIKSGKMLRRSSIQQTNKYYGSKTQNKGLTFHTIESHMSKINKQEMHDSDSEQSDDDFGGYIINKKVRKTVHSKKLQKHISPRKSNYNLSPKSFINFRIRSISINSNQTESDIIVIEEGKEANIMLNTIQPAFGKIKTKYFNEYYNNKSLKINRMNINISRQRSGGINNTEIIGKLQNLGYKQEQILEVMKVVQNPNSFNEIQQLLDMKKRAKKRKFIEQEIVSTEEIYVQGLDTLLNELIQPMFDNGYIEKQYYNRIRSSVPNIFEFHKKFLKKLNMAYIDKYQTLASVFNECIVANKEMFIDMYLKYLNEYVTILDMFGITFHGNVKLNNFLTEKRTDGKPLSNFLILPVQRNPRYILLLRDLLKNTEKKSDDYKDMSSASQMLNDVTMEINDRKGKIENLSNCMQLQEALNGLQQPIVNDNRMFIQQFIFIKKTIKHQRIFFVFNDIIIIGNEKWEVKHILDIKTLDVKIVLKNNSIKFLRKSLPEFVLISAGIGSVEYIAEDMETINKFTKIIDKHKKND
eukprot:418490_1